MTEAESKARKELEAMSHQHQQRKQDAATKRPLPRPFVTTCTDAVQALLDPRRVIMMTMMLMMMMRLPLRM